MKINGGKKGIEHRKQLFNKTKNLLTTNDNVFYTLADLANIKYPSYLNTQSISDYLYKEPSSKFVYTNGTCKEYKKILTKISNYKSTQNNK